MSCETCGRLDCTYPHCVDCRRPMRKGRHKAADHPGTALHTSTGRCNTCWYRQKPKRKKKPITGEPHPATVQSLSAYLKWRAPFRAKAGIQ